jgi:SPP1 gp7 family putative phage head morphogenesis protein
MATIFQQDFWDDEMGGLWDEIAETMLEIYFHGIDGGVSALPPQLRVLVDFDRINQDAMQFAKDYKYNMIKGINDTTRKQTQKAVTDWIHSGSPLEALEKVLEPIYGQVRSQMIAQTETTRVFAQGNRDAFESTDLVEQVKWQAANDELVCPICGELNNTLIDVADISALPPAHINCRCYILPVVSEDALARKLDEVLS